MPDYGALEGVAEASEVETVSPTRSRSPRGAVSLLRVALFTNSLSPHSLPLCEYLSKRVGEFCAFLSSESDPYHHFPKVQASFPVRLQRSLNSSRLPRRAYGYWQKSELHVPYDTYHQLGAYRPDLILSLQFGLRSVLAAMYRARHPGVKLVLWAALSRHTEQKRHWVRRLVRQWLVRHIDGAFVNGKAGEEYLRLLGFQGRTYNIPYAIDETLFRAESYQPRPGVFRLVYAGHLLPQKGLRQFCDGLNGWCGDHPATEVCWEVIGNGPDGRLLQERATAPNFKLSVLAAMDQEQLAQHYRAADVLAFPTLGDEWGVVVNEAMIAGLPVLGSVYSQAVMELVEEGGCGWKFDPLNPADLSDAFDRAFGSSVEELKAMSASVRVKVAEVSPEVVAERAVRALEEIAKGASL